MSESIDIKLLSEHSNVIDIATFLNNVLPFEYSQAIFNWEYGQGKSTFGYLENSNTEILGAQGMIPIRLNFNHGVKYSAKSETSYLSERVKGKGLFKKLYSHVIEETFRKEIVVIWGFTSLGKLWQKMGFQVQENCLFTYSISINSKKSYYFNKDQKGKKTVLYLRYFKAIFSSIKTRLKCSRIRLKKKQQSQLKCYEQLLNSNDLILFFSALRAQNEDIVHIEMDEVYLNYRISTNPFLNYSSKFLYDTDNKLVGFYILSVKDNIANLVEFNGESESVKTSLLKEAIDEARHLKVVRLNIFGNNLNPLMRASFDLFNNFGATSFDTNICLVALNKEKTAPMDFKNWYINGLWTEGINQ